MAMNTDGSISRGRGKGKFRGGSSLLVIFFTPL